MPFARVENPCHVLRFETTSNEIAIVFIQSLRDFNNRGIAYDMLGGVGRLKEPQ
jgi:hypothetical protein